MIRQYLGRFTTIALVVGVLGLVWSIKGTQYGQDLAGGAELRYGITQRVSERYDELRRYLSDAEDSRRVEERRARIAELRSDLERATGPEADRIRRQIEEIEFSLDPSRVRDAIEQLEQQRRAVGAGADIVRERIAGSGLGDIDVRTVGTSRILIRIPFRRMPNESVEAATERFNRQVDGIQSVVSQQGVLGFHLGVDMREVTDDAEKRVSEGRAAPSQFYYAIPHDQFAEAAARLAERGFDDPLEAGYISWSRPPAESRRRTGQDLLVIRREASLDGAAVDQAFPRLGDQGWEVSLDFTSSGEGKFEQLTGANVNKRLAIVLDNVLHTAPVIQGRIGGGSARITGSFGQAEATDLSTVISAGSLPVQIDFESKSVVGPSLGRDSINRGLMSLMIGTGAVLLFIQFYYLSAGTIANIAMAFNLVIIMGALSLFSASLTLPGIAGVLLTVGMAIDANVLIFERIREEKAKGRTLRLAVESGYDRAFITIVDANVTTLITAMVLYWFGTGPIRGFAITLTIGILASLFTALYASRALVEYLVAKSWISEMSMFQALGKTSFRFMRARAFAYALSAVLIVGSVYAFFSHTDKYGIDFTGGTLLQVQLDEPMSDGQMRAAATEALAEMQRRENESAAEAGREAIDFGAPRVQAYNAEAEVEGIGRTSSTYSLMLRMDAHQAQQYQDEVRSVLGESLNDDDPFPAQDSIGTAVSEELSSSAMRSLIFAMLLIFLYIVLRFEFNPSYGVGAVVAVGHDVLVTVGVLVGADWLGLVPAKIDLPAVAALLTIVGYSLNDTIVIFDRIRELRLENKTKPLKEVVDNAVNATLSRSLITSVTTFVAVLALFLFGGDATKGFSFAMLVGVVVGTYSSIFIAAPLVVQWEQVRERPRVKKAVLLTGAAILIVGFGALVARAVWTTAQEDRREESREKIVTIWNAFAEHASKHGGRFPESLDAIAGVPAVENTRALAGPLDEGVAYNYVSGVSRDDPPDTVVLFSADGLHPYGGHVLFADGRLQWFDERRIRSIVRASMEKLSSEGRSVRVIQAESQTEID